MGLSTGFKWLGTRSNGGILETRKEPSNSTKANESLTVSQDGWFSYGVFSKIQI